MTCRHWLAALGILVAMGLPFQPAAAAADCRFALGFATLQALIPAQVGDCRGNETHNPTNGDALQQTTGGLLVWRHSDNWTAFTDGARTWINGPLGLAERRNSERFPWEADFAADPRFGVIMVATPPDGAVHALNLLHARWFEGIVGNDLEHSPTELELADRHDMAALAAEARRYPGRAWFLGLEPNGASAHVPEADPVAYATMLHTVSRTLHVADPTARLVGPDILNWEAQCFGCSGMVTGRDWTMAMRDAYLAQYGQELPFDVWGLHTYPLDWQHLPTVNYALMEQQLVQLRAYLDSIPDLKDKPIWDTELGVHWGYTAYQFVQRDGNSIIVPAGTPREDLVVSYLQQFLGWLTRNGRRYQIERWFVYGAYNPDKPGETAGAIALLDGPGGGAQLTPMGRVYAAAEQR